MANVQIKIPQAVVQKYLSEKEGAPVKILKYEKLGSGWHGTGYKIKYRGKGQGARDKEVVLRTLMPSGFGHDWLSDRAGSFVLQHQLAQAIPDHIQSFDVSGYSKDNKLVSLGDIKEFFHVVKVAKGET